MSDGLDALMMEDAELEEMMRSQREEDDSAGSSDTRYNGGYSSRSSRPFMNKQ
eukprot:SAG22_NODE_1453_length_4394_cov_29.832363_5_plen_53_part_00